MTYEMKKRKKKHIHTVRLKIKLKMPQIEKKNRKGKTYPFSEAQN